MSEEAFVSFTFDPAPPGREIPDWMWEKPVSARIRLADMVEIFGPPGSDTPDQFLARHRVALEAAARGKTAHLRERPHEPVELTPAAFTI